MNRVEPNRNVYVGHRYVPLLVGEWDKSIQYEGLSIVTYKGASYTSKKRTPPGIDIENEEYWVLTGNYNAQIEYYRDDVKTVKDSLSSKADRDEVENVKNSLSLKADNEDLLKFKNETDNHFKAMKINVLSPPDGLKPAVGDGTTDDYEALQAIFDYAYETGRHSVYIPTPKSKYRISKPLVQKTKRVSSDTHWWDGEGLQIEGEHMAKTIISKDFGTVHDDYHEEVNGIDAVIIPLALETLSGTGGTGTGNMIKNLYLENNMNNVNAYGLYGRATQRGNYEDLNIKSYKGIYFPGCFSSVFRNIVFQTNEESLFVNGGTSNIFERIYSSACKNPYKINSAYSSLISVYGDACTGTIFDVRGNACVMVSCGTESPKAQYIVSVKGRDSVLNIVSLSLHRQEGDVENNINIEDCAIFHGRGKIKCGSVDILENRVIDGTSYLTDSENINYDFSVEVNRLNRYNNYSGSTTNLPLKLAKTHSNSSTSGKIGTYGSDVMVRRNNMMPYIGSRDIDEVYDTNFISKAIHLDNDDWKTSSNGDNLEYEMKYNRGDILVINDPEEMNMVGYTVINEGETYVRDGKYGIIPYIQSGKTEERPTGNLYVGQQYFDTTLMKPIWVKYTDTETWVDSTGTEA